MSMNYALLKKAVPEGKLAHFLLFHGSGAEERYRAVLDLALVLNCRGDGEKPCGHCPACKKILSGNHPDIHMVKPFKASIGIEQVLTFQSKIYRKTYEGGFRVCLMEEADKLTLPAANALLKITEEPPENTVIILSTSNAEGVIGTLRSRAQTVYFSPPNEGEWKDEIEVFRLSGGDPDLARLIQGYGYQQVRNWIEKYLKLIYSGDFLELFKLFPLEKQEILLLLQVLAHTLKGMVAAKKISPQFLYEIGAAIEMIRRQANSRLVLEVLAIKHIRLGGTEIG
ncbi:MAG: DNA polymerase III subunit gamma/tau [Candidatus Dichloromethanomonas elyunquensis]|nr:MAG: DNA polymerase III subunit gamma/tau [Candidatus Dichloromethanomonas elyunquensis]